MSETLMEFVGGPEDGKLRYVEDGLTQCCVAETPRPRVIAGLGDEPCSATYRLLIYVRCGDKMILSGPTKPRG